MSPVLSVLSNVVISNIIISIVVVPTQHHTMILRTMILSITKSLASMVLLSVVKLSVVMMSAHVLNVVEPFETNPSYSPKHFHQTTESRKHRYLKQGSLAEGEGSLRL